MRRIIYLVAKNGLTVPEDCDADLLADDLIDVLRDNDTTIHNTHRTASLKKLSAKAPRTLVLTIEEIK